MGLAYSKMSLCEPVLHSAKLKASGIYGASPLFTVYVQWGVIAVYNMKRECYICHIDNTHYNHT